MASLASGLCDFCGFGLLVASVAFGCLCGVGLVFDGLLFVALLDFVGI